MEDFLEFDDIKKTVKSINLDDFSVEDLNHYIKELEEEIKRTNLELIKKNKVKKEAEKFFI